MSGCPAKPPSRIASTTRRPTPDGYTTRGPESPKHIIEITRAIRLYTTSSAWNRRRDANRQASALEIYNAEFALIYTLPPELTHRVLKYLLTADIMCLRLVSRRFFCRTRRQNSTWSDKRDFQARLQLDTYTKLAGAEPKDIRRLSELGCSFCHQTHPRRAFDRKEIIKSPHIRQCQGASRHIRVCAHTSKDRTSIKAGIPLLGVCGPCRVRFWFNRSTDISDMIYGAERWLDPARMDRVITRVELQNDLKQLAMSVCPHMRTDDAVFLNRVLTNRRGNMWNDYNNGKPADGTFAGAYETSCIRVNCLHQRCDTTVEIERKAGTGGIWPIQVRLRRNLGKLKDVMDPKWLIQLEKPGP